MNSNDPINKSSLTVNPSSQQSAKPVVKSPLDESATSLKDAMRRVLPQGVFALILSAIFQWQLSQQSTVKISVVIVPLGFFAACLTLSAILASFKTISVLYKAHIAAKLPFCPLTFFCLAGIAFSICAAVLFFAALSS